MSEYKIQKVSSQPPRSWSFTDRKTGAAVEMETYRVMLEGVSDPVEVNKKAGTVPQVGDVLTGNVESTEYGYRFKAAPKPRPSFTPKDNTEIRAQMSVKAAANLVAPQDGWTLDDVERVAKGLYSMVDRVKAPATGYEKAKAQAEKLKTKTTFSDGSPVPDEVIPVSGDEEINLDDIPF